MQQDVQWYPVTWTKRAKKNPFKNWNDAISLKFDAFANDATIYSMMKLNHCLQLIVLIRAFEDGISVFFSRSI